MKRLKTKKKICFLKNNLLYLYHNLRKKEMINLTKQNEDVRVVYDIHLDGTIINALGWNVMSNTDG